MKLTVAKAASALPVLRADISAPNIMAKKAATKEKAKLTPMMEQYWGVKERYPDCMLFYRMGDFYELFFDDAVDASKILDIALTKRGKHEGNAIPMCGVPVHSHESYLQRLIRTGRKVAICDQTETPEEAKKRGGYKALVNRDVVRVITRGTLTEDSLLPNGEHNYLAALCQVGHLFGLSWLDISTGSFYTQEVTKDGLLEALQRVAPKEILLTRKLFEDDALAPILFDFRDALTPLENSQFDSTNAKKRLLEKYEVKTLDAFGSFSRGEISCAGALLVYVDLTQKGHIPHLKAPQKISLSGVVHIDPAARQNLELTRTLTGERKGSLLDTIDRTITGAGARLFSMHLSAPLTDLPTINSRLDEVECFLNAPEIRKNIRELLSHVPDIERGLSRLSLGRGGPRDLIALANGLKAASSIRTHLIKSDATISDFAEKLHMEGSLNDYVDTLSRALVEDAPIFSRDGGFIRQGYDAHLDSLKQMRDKSRNLIAALQSRYANDTGVSSLKIRHNNILGYFVEVTSSHGSTLMGGNDNTPSEDNPFIHRQTMANAVRFTTVELSELERDISSAADKALALELSIFDIFVLQVNERANVISSIATALARIDVATSMAELAAQENYTRPTLSGDHDFVIKGGRHPVVEKSLKNTTDCFIANDCDLSESNKLQLLTGPNMAGKSTFLRQNALIAIMAQAGFYVPAKSVTIGIIDKVFSRVGASDDLAHGRSTFMVEMVETAAILNQATDKSLVVLDEIGRGTATYDGLSIAWACLEYLHNANKCRCLFATHYHELTMLEEKLDQLSCYSIKVKEWDGDIIFMHEVIKGSADKSYGIHVAKLAGLPSSVIMRAQDVLSSLQDSNTAKALDGVSDALPLFNYETEQPLPPQNSKVEEELKEINPDTLTPRDALDILYSLKEQTE